MLNETNELQVQRYFDKLYNIIARSIPRFTGYNEPHPYATGNMYRNMTVVRDSKGYRIIISIGVPYSQAALGFKDDGSKLNPRGPHEVHNFSVIETSINLTNKILGGHYAYVNTK